MNKYWIHKPTGAKARMIASPAYEKDVNKIWLEDQKDKHQFWAYHNTFGNLWIPITKAEYEYNITLKEIQAAREQQISDDIVKDIGVGQILICKKDITGSVVEKGRQYEVIKVDDYGIAIKDCIDDTVALVMWKKVAESFTFQTDIHDFDRYLGEHKHEASSNKSEDKNIQLKADHSNLEIGGTHYQKPIQVWDFKHIINELSSIYTSKNHDYGNSFEELYKECGMTYAYGHLKEKLNRIKSLIKSDNKVSGESIEDSLLDLANYAILTLMEIRKEKDNE